VPSSTWTTTRCLVNSTMALKGLSSDLLSTTSLTYSCIRVSRSSGKHEYLSKVDQCIRADVNLLKNSEQQVTDEFFLCCSNVLQNTFYACVKSMYTSNGSAKLLFSGVLSSRSIQNGPQHSCMYVMPSSMYGCRQV